MCSFLWLQGYGHCDILDKAGYNRKYTIDFYHARDWEARMSNSKDAFSTLFVITYHSFSKLYYTIDFYPARDWGARMCNSKDAVWTLYGITFLSFIRLPIAIFCLNTPAIIVALCELLCERAPWIFS